MSFPEHPSEGTPDLTPATPAESSETPPATRYFEVPGQQVTPPDPTAPPAEIYPGQQPYATDPYLPQAYGSQPYPPQPYTAPWMAPDGVAVMAPPTPDVALLARRLPAWALIAAGVVTLVGLIALAVTGSDWGYDGLRLGLGALIAALAIAIVTGTRAAGGLVSSTNANRRAQLIGAGSLFVTFLVIGGLGFGLQSPLHSAQGSAFESQKQWQKAVDQFQLAGESAPNSNALARVYNEWGESLTTSHEFETAVGKFDIVIEQFAQSSGITRAHQGKITALIGWGKQANSNHNYDEAAQHFDDVLGLEFCDNACKTTATAPAATAYYGLGQEQISSGSCDSAIATYQALTTKFPNTTEGKEAATDLKAPQPVKAHFTMAIPANAIVIGLLAQNLNYSMSDTDLSNALNAIPASRVAAAKANGDITIPSVAQGVYDFIWLTYDATTENLLYPGIFFYKDSGAPAFVTNVGPLCAVDLGDIDLPVVPTAGSGFSATFTHQGVQTQVPFITALKQH